MKIVHVTHRAWPVVGGSERYVQEVARRQVSDGYQVTILATDARELSALWSRKGSRVDAEAAGEHEGVQIRRLPARGLPGGDLGFAVFRRLAWLVSCVSGGMALRLGRLVPWVPALLQTLTEELPDLVFGWNITLEGLSVAVAGYARRQGVPWIAVPLLHLGSPRFYTMRHQLSLLRQASLVLAQTSGERAFLLKRGFDPRQVDVVSPGLDPRMGSRADGRRFRQEHEVADPLVVTMGSLSYNKGTLHLIAAAQRLWQQGRHLTLALVGSMDKSVRQAVTRLPKDQRAYCRCLGEIPEDAKWDVLDAADVFILPSRTESFGIVFLEAWSLAKPVIGARSGVVGDVIVQGVDGLLVPFGDVAGLADAICTLLDDPGKAAEMGQRGKQKVLQEYTWERQYDHLRALVDQVVMESRKNERV